MIDAIDIAVLKIIQANAKTSNADVARQVGMAASAIFERIKKLEASGWIMGYHAKLSPKDLGLGLVAFVFVRADDMAGELAVGERLAQIPEVQEVHHVAGEDCYLAKVRAKDTEDLGHLLRDRFAAIEGLRSTRTTIVLNTLKEIGEIPLNGAV